MSRRALVILLSVGAVMLAAFVQPLGQPQEETQPLLVLVGVPALAAAILASIDLRRRGYRWGWAMLAAFLIQPLGLILYVIFSGRRGYQQPAQPRDLAPQPLYG